jgi:putative transposase
MLQQYQTLASYCKLFIALVNNFATHPRYQVHSTPTYASWLNQVEIWFNIITQRAIRHGTFKSVKDLTAKSEQFVAEYNCNSHTFAWTATADSILEKVKRLCQIISGTKH